MRFYRCPVPMLVLLTLLLLPGCRSQSEQTPTPAAVIHSSFDGDHAYAMLQAQCAFGVRPPGSSAHEKCKTYILNQLTPLADKVSTQTFSYHDSDRHVTLHLTNIIGVINPAAKKKICLFTHWDTRPTADQDLDHKDQPIMGADDGASGTAALVGTSPRVSCPAPGGRRRAAFCGRRGLGARREPHVLGLYLLRAEPWYLQAGLCDPAGHDRPEKTS